MPFLIPPFVRHTAPVPGIAPGIVPGIVMVCAALLTGCTGAGLRGAAPPAPMARGFATSDIVPDPGFRMAVLDNGLRTIVRSNATPAGTAQVRLVIEAGSLDEAEDERGTAHFVEHMAFNGSRHVREGEMVRLLQRDGLAFGADTNASTGFERTIYQLDLPRADPALLDTALMLMRETASELSFDPAAVDRERGVVLSEMREGRGYALADRQDMMRFLYPHARYIERLPIGTEASVRQADAATLRAFWQAHYRPDRASVVIVGDFPAAVMTRAIAAHFADWQAGGGAGAGAAAAPPRPDPGRVEPDRRDLVDIHIDPALTERVTISRHGRWIEERDTIAARRHALLRLIGYRMIDRRLQSVARRSIPPFRGAGFGTAPVFHIGRTTNLVIDTQDGQWRRGMIAAGAVLRQALTQGFTRAELDEQLAGLRADFENAAAAGDTRSHGALVQAALALITDQRIPTTPADALARFNAFAPTITLPLVREALAADAVPLDQPLIRFHGRHAPEGGSAALRAAWDEGTRATATVYTPVTGQFAYDRFGAAGTIVEDRREPVLGLRQVRFANGVRLNLKHTDLEHDRIRVSLALAGGETLGTRANPLAVAMVPVLAQGGLGRHSADDLQTLLAGRAVGGSLTPDGDAFVAEGTTTPRDLAMQCAYLAALITDPGYRPEAEATFHQSIAQVLARRNATARSALGNAIGGVLSDNDPRFTLAAPEAYRALNFARLRADVGERLAHGAIEIGMVGDIDESAAIAAVAQTLGALPPREAEFRIDPAALDRHFTDHRGAVVVRHDGPADQAIVRMEWPTTDDRDERLELTLDLLQDMVTIAVEDTLREAMGKTYSPRASSAQSDFWPGWGTFQVQAAVATADLAATRAAMRATMAGLIAAPADADLIARARAPLVQRIDNALKGNGGWMALVARAQTRPERIARHMAARSLLEGITAADLREAAARFLAPDRAVEVLVLPAGAAAPGA